MESGDPPRTPIDLGGPAAETPATEPVATAGPADSAVAERSNMLPRRGSRRFGIERLLVRLIATCGIVGIGVLLGAILVSQKVEGWICGLVIAGVTVILSAVLWSSRQV